MTVRCHADSGESASNLYLDNNALTLIALNTERESAPTEDRLNKE